VFEYKNGAVLSEELWIFALPNFSLVETYKEWLRHHKRNE
jgi:hypothetical protein